MLRNEWFTLPRNEWFTLPRNTHLAQRSKDFDQESFFHIKNNSNMERWKKLIYKSSKGGTLIYLTNAGHYIQNDQPQSIISNLKILVESLKE